ncbi:hypothetical protein ABMA70_14545 [Halobacteriovorax sp. XZX-3]|uniref:hypothetical protein n=1 Tax=unclassified Halobacteriovorax TaxID=2639665 RepID=UPI000CD07537|nr:hypothetical protein [Halobacteriovorax sp. DA5]POB13691.1 hypothetical protein C0Z22_09050 [Halobacteriovorax sp. DA5]
MKTLTILALTFLLAFSTLADGEKKRDRKHKKDRSARYEKMTEMDGDFSKLSKGDLKKLESEFAKFQDEQHKKKVAFEKKVFSKREKFLKDNEALMLKHLDEIYALKKKLQFGKKEENKNIRKQIKEKSKEFRKSMKQLRHKDQRDSIRSMKKEFFEEMKVERKKFKEKIKSYSKKS